MSELAIIHEDQALLQLIAGGDERAFRVIFNKYHNRLGAHLRRVTRSRELAQEVVQDVFMKLWVNRAQLPEIHDFKAYLYVVSRNHALNCLKKIALENTLSIALDENHDFGPEEEAGENEQYLLIDEAIDHLPPRQKQIYLMSRHERLKYQEIATRLSLSRETVKKYLQISSESITTYVRKRLIVSIIISFLVFC